LVNWLAEHPHWSRRKLAGELCSLWQWRDATGRLKDLAARSFLLKLESRGLIVLPALREAYRKPRATIAPLQHPPAALQVEASFGEIAPIALEVIEAGTEASRRWAHHLTHHHYLGLRIVGQNLGYLAIDRHGREVAALLFGAPAWRCRSRDAFFISQGEASAASDTGAPSLTTLANNTRFLILPGVRVPHLASHLLGAAARRIGPDWLRKYGVRLRWLETFVERGRFAGTCYRAANWIHVGSTCGRGRQDRHHCAKVPTKDVYLYRLKA
jgi:Domain of unknown function (DUF4338)